MSDYATKYPEIFAMLASPFSDEEVRARTQSGRQLLYVTAAAVSNRLDDAVGPENWEFDLTPWGDDALFGRLTITLPGGEKVSKTNVGGCADMAEGDNDAKSAASDALKRCAALFGVARYLYQSGHPEFARPIFDNFRGHQNVQGGGGGFQSSPRPDFGPAPSRPNGGGGGGNGGGNGGNYGDPKTGGQLFAWAKKKTDEEPALDLVKRIDKWAQQKGFPYKWKEWNDQQVAEAYAAARKVVASGGESAAPAQQPIGRDYDPATAKDDDIPF